jgi:hypothetical protein
MAAADWHGGAALAFAWARLATQAAEVVASSCAQRQGACGGCAFGGTRAPVIQQVGGHYNMGAPSSRDGGEYLRAGTHRATRLPCKRRARAGGACAPLRWRRCEAYERSREEKTQYSQRKNVPELGVSRGGFWFIPPTFTLC